MFRLPGIPTVHGRSEDGRLGAAAEPVLADVNDRGFEVAKDGSFEVILSPDERPGNWIALPPGAASVSCTSAGSWGS